MPAGFLFSSLKAARWTAPLASFLFFFMSEIAKAYEPKEVEQRWYANWLEAGCFKAEADSAKEPYAIMIPPPNVTGMLHICIIRTLEKSYRKII